MKRILFFLCMILAFASCHTSELTKNQRRAQRHLKKALRLDSAIVTKQITPTVITGVATGDVIDTEKGFAYTLADFQCDSILNELNRLLAASGTPQADSNTGIILHDDSDLTIKAKPGKKKGTIDIDIHAKDKIVPKTFSIPYQTTVNVPGKVFTQYITKPFYSYWQYWLSMGLLAMIFAFCLRLFSR